jgi:hypothetical protein
MAICTNCALLVCLYDQEERWKIEPGLAAILLMEHVLLLIKFGIACLVPEVSIYYFPTIIWCASYDMRLTFDSMFICLVVIR